MTLTDGPATGPRRGQDLRRLGVVPDGAVAVAEGRVVAVGTTADIHAEYRARKELDLTGFVIVPGFVDPHVHLVHLDSDGIADLAQVVARVREASLDELTHATRRHLEDVLARGTTAVGIETGYGMDAASEAKSAQAATAAAGVLPLRASVAFLAAHQMLPGDARDLDDYVRRVIERVLPAVAPHCGACDVHVAPGGLQHQHAEAILEAARARGMRLSLLTDPVPMGGAEIGLELAVSVLADLVGISVAAMERLASSAAVAVLLPGARVAEPARASAPARALIDSGCAVALASDANPLACTPRSMRSVIVLAHQWLGMSVEECLTAATINAAAALGLDAELGSLHAGKRADLVALELPTHRALGASLDDGPAALVVAGGEPVFLRTQDRDPDI